VAYGPLVTRKTTVELESTTITRGTVVDEVTKLKNDGYRFVTMSVVDLDEDSVDILYHFDKDLDVVNLRMAVPKKEPVPSISGVYFAAFLIENESKDHFGLEFDGLVLDFGGTLYLEEEVQRTPFCKYGVIRKDAEAAPEGAA
jgi:ech hydrogenase subunit D